MPLFRGTRLPLLLEPDIKWLLRDEFTMALAAGSVHGTAAEPGPGTRVVVDTESKLSIASGALTFAGGKATPAYGDPMLSETAFTRTPGMLGFCSYKYSVAGSASIGFPGTNSLGTADSGNVFLVEPDVLRSRWGSSHVTVCSTQVNITYSLGLALRTVGAYYFTKGGVFTNWTLLFVSPISNRAELAPTISNHSVVFTSSFLRIPTTLWLPSPLLSDGFGGTWLTSDGLGHAEGIAGGLGIGGGGLTWTAVLGTWGIAAGVASCSALDGGSGLGIATIDAGKADVWFSCVPAYSAGSAGVIVRYADAANYSYVIHDGTNVKLFTVTTADPYPGTEWGTKVKALAAGARLIVDVSGASIRVYYNEALMFTYATMPDTTATKIGMFTTNVNNTFDDFVGYAKGSNNEYGILDKYSKD